MHRAIPASGWGLVAVLVTVTVAVAVAVAARADPAPPAAPRPVNLLTDAPAVVAVSSTVGNRAIVPAHLVDGDLGTAWNSRTGDLQGAWIGARVPADARVTTIRMTVGFTRIDPKLGDLFTMNPRIRKVRVLRNGASVLEQALDPTVRTLQDIAVDQPGGEYKIQVVDIVPGTKASWREICVSELEIWGTLAPGTPSRRRTPVVRVGAFGPPLAIARADCIAAMFPDATGDSVALANGPEVLGNVEVVALAADLAVCRVEHTRERTEPWEDLYGITEMTFADTAIELAPIARVPQLTAGERMVAATSTTLRDIKFAPDSPGLGDVDHTDRTVKLAVFPLTATEKSLLVEVTEHDVGALLNNARTTSTLYRVSAAELTEILSYEANSDVDHEAHVDRSEHCRLAPAVPKAAAPPPLVITCELTERSMARAGDRGTTTRRTARYVWNNDRYWPE